MPELPEVETVRSGLQRHLRGMKLDRTTLRRQDLRWPIPGQAVAALGGQPLDSVHRRGKYLLLAFGDRTALVHLGMSGRLFLGRPDAAWQKHEHWRMYFGDRVLRYVDARRFGVLDVVATAGLATHRLLRSLGPEPLGSAFDGAYLWRVTRRKSCPIQALLMDSRRVVGIGNIYANEALFHAGIAPRRRAGRLTRRECAQLAAAVREVLHAAIDCGGTTLRDYIGADAQEGWFQQELRVYGRAGAPCRVCATPVREVQLGGRSTCWCPTCQD